MSTNYSPSIVTNGLIFYYDMNNTAKSWKGQPTTNLCSSNGIHTNWNNSGTAIWSSDDNYVPRVFPSIPVISMYKDTAGNSHIANGFANISSGLVYTVSTYVYIPSNAGTIAGSVPYMRTFPANTGRGNLLYEGNSNWNTWPRDRWIRISNSFTNSAGDTSMYISCYLDNQGNKIYMTAPMVEQRSVLSSYVEINSTRSSTQALLDLTGRNTITTDSLTYNNDSTFSFNGTTNYARCTNNCNLTDSITISAWIKNFYSGSGPHKTVLCTDIAYRYGVKLMNFKNNSRYGLWLGFGSSDYEAFTSVDINDNIIKMLTGSWNRVTGQVKLYINGVLTTTISTGITSLIVLADGQITIGAEYHSLGNNGFGGNIYNGQIYNRALTDNEVAQNFAALRGRYGV